MDLIHDRYPEQYEKCGNVFACDQKTPTDNPSRHQWFELPIVKPIKEVKSIVNNTVTAKIKLSEHGRAEL
jgi:hypothetical protein